MINNHPPFQGLDIRIPIIIPIKGRGFINHGSGLGFIVFSRVGSKEGFIGIYTEV